MTYHRSLGLVLALASATASAACNAFGIFGEDDNEVRVTITALGINSLTADDGYTYTVDGNTEYEGAGLTGFADLAVGEVVEIEWESAPAPNTRRAAEIEAGDHDETGDDD